MLSLLLRGWEERRLQHFLHALDLHHLQAAQHLARDLRQVSVCLACKRFIFVENILPADPKAETSEDKPTEKRSLTEARDLIFRAMDGIEQEDDWYSLGQVGQFITAANPDFDTRTYGKRKLSDLVQSLKMLEVKRGAGNQLLVRRLD